MKRIPLPVLAICAVAACSSSEPSEQSQRQEQRPAPAVPSVVSFAPLDSAARAALRGARDPETMAARHVRLRLVGVETSPEHGVALRVSIGTGVPDEKIGLGSVVPSSCGPSGPQAFLLSLDEAVAEVRDWNMGTLVNEGLPVHVEAFWLRKPPEGGEPWVRVSEARVEVILLRRTGEAK